MGRRNRKWRDEDPAHFDKSSETFRWFNTVLHQAPALVIVGGEGRLELPADFTTGSLFDQASAYGGLIPALWSFMLAARARGLGALWTTLHLKHANEIGELLDLPKDFTQVALLPVGYHTGNGFKRATRRSAGKAIHWDRW